MALPEPLLQLVTLLKRLPGVGEKSARRMAFFIIQQPGSYPEELAIALHGLKERLCECSKCGNITDVDPCSICTDPLRERQTLCVVETAEDLLSMEQAGIYNGLYHVLKGKISPLDGEDLPPSEYERLKERIINTRVKEVIIATNPRVEGDLTFYSLFFELEDLDVKISRLAYGLPVGGSIEFADRITLHAAFESRVDVRKNKRR